MLRTTNVPVSRYDDRRLDLLVPGLRIFHGRPLFVDVTVVTPISAKGQPRSGTNSRGGALLEDATKKNNETYHEVANSDLGMFLSLGCEVYGRWSEEVIDILPRLAFSKTEFLPSRTQRGVAMLLLKRWAGMLGVALQQEVHNQIQCENGADLNTTLVERVCHFSDLC